MVPGPNFCLKAKQFLLLTRQGIEGKQEECKLRYTGAQLVMGLEKRGKLQLRFAFVAMRRY